MRLNRFLAAAGLGSRRGVEEIITSGQVRINGQVVTDLATKVLPTDFVKVGSKRVQVEQLIHAVLYKPRGFVCTADDECERRIIFELLPKNFPRVFHVGRLDMDSEGLLILTNDGDLGLQLTHPRYHVDKEYEVLLDRPFNEEHRAQLLTGFHIQGGRAKIESITRIKSKLLKIILRQGIKRQIRLMFYELGYEVERLCRIRVGPITLGDMEPGQWRHLLPKEVEALKVSSSPAPARKPRPPLKAATTPRKRAPRSR